MVGIGDYSYIEGCKWDYLLLLVFQFSFFAVFGMLLWYMKKNQRIYVISEQCKLHVFANKRDAIIKFCSLNDESYLYETSNGVTLDGILIDSSNNRNFKKVVRSNKLP